MTQTFNRTPLESELSAAFGSPVRFDDRGFARVNAFGRTVALEFNDSRETLTLYVSLGNLPPEAPAEFTETLLTANFLGAETGGGHIGLHPRTRAVVFSLSLMPELLREGEVTSAALRFVAAARERSAWFRELERAAPTAATKRSEAADPHALRV